ncbi:hypothetical protein J6590_034155 [Homalodisca vitripennis]|nr:hypothetical protein J6590_034155 [Homalodisca vitripennis]
MLFYYVTVQEKATRLKIDGWFLGQSSVTIEVSLSSNNSPGVDLQVNKGYNSDLWEIIVEPIISTFQERNVSHSQLETCDDSKADRPAISRQLFQPCSRVNYDSLPISRQRLMHIDVF